MANQTSHGTRFRFAQAFAVFTLSLVIFLLIAWKNTRFSNGIHFTKAGGTIRNPKIPTRQLERLQRIKKYCATHNQPSQKIDLSNFLVLEDEKVIYCSTPKVACSTWKRILAKVQGLNVSAKQGIHLYTRGKFKMLNQFSAEEQKEKLSTYTKFFFVREPYERLLSAYRDCFFGSYKRKQEYWKNYGRFIINMLEKYGGRNSSQGKETITFSEFIAYLDIRNKRGEKFQEHWRPQHQLCQPCFVQYDIVGHYETFLDDARYIFSTANFGRKVQLPQWHPSSTGPLLKKYYSEISKESIQKATNLYRADFRLFGYWHPDEKT